MNINKIYTGDCCELMSSMSDGVVDLAFVDPPYNIGFDYGEGEYKDKLTPEAYAQWCETWMRHLYRVLKSDGTFWLAIGDEWAAELKVISRQLGFHMRSWIVWYYTFGVNSPKKFTRSHAHLFYFTKHKKKFTFNPDQIRVPSARLLEYNDKRANPEGRLPDDTWILRPKMLPDGFPADGDTWFIPRICGTFAQRIEGAANQMPEQLMGRIIRSCSNPGDLVFDPMSGTGTTCTVAKKLSRDYLGFEMSPVFSEMIVKRVRGACVGNPLDGPIPQGG